MKDDAALRAEAERRVRIAERFGRASAYDSAAWVQALTARRLVARIASAFGEAVPRRILEFGCGTGNLTAELRACWPDAEIVATDLSAPMLERARHRCGDKGVTYAVMDAADPVGPEAWGRFDLVCGNLALQWIEARDEALAALARLLHPGGRLGLTTLAVDSFVEWRDAHRAMGEVAATHRYPALDTLQAGWPHASHSHKGFPAASGRWHAETILESTGGGLAFLRGLRAIGATEPAAGRPSLSPGALRRVIACFDAAGAAMTWQIAYGVFRTAPRAGVFVTGTDTGVGKTFVSACLTRAWDALYWKPMQTGLAEEDGDTPTVAHLAGAASDRIVPPTLTFLAPLSPEAAAAAEGRVVDLRSVVLPLRDPARPMIVEGAGGLMVPITPADPSDGTAGAMMLDLMVELGLPVVLVARSTLGTINHTLLSLQALRDRGVAVAGVVLNGPLSPDNRAAIETHGAVRVLAEIPFYDAVTPETVAEGAAHFTEYADTL